MRIGGEIFILNAQARWWQIGADKSVHYPAPLSCSKTYFFICSLIRLGKIMIVLSKYFMDERLNISNTAQNRIMLIQIGLTNFPIYGCELV